MYVGALPPASNRARYELTLTVLDANTGDAIDLSDYGITFCIRDPVSQTAMITATDSNGIDIADAASGIFVVELTATQMRTLDPKQYHVGVTVAPDSDPTDSPDQYIIGTLNVLDGVVT